MTKEQVEGISTSFCNSISNAFNVEPMDPSNLSDSLLLSWAECAGYQSPSSEEVIRISQFCCLRIQKILDLDSTTTTNHHKEKEEENKDYLDSIRALFTAISRVLRISISFYPDLIFNLLYQNVIDWSQISITPNNASSINSRPYIIAIGLKRLGFRLVGAFVKFSSVPNLSLESEVQVGVVGAGNPATTLIEKIGNYILLGFNDQGMLVFIFPFLV